MRILAEKLGRRFRALMGICSVFWEALDAEGEIDLNISLFRHDDLLQLEGEAFMPCFQFVGACRYVFDFETAGLVGGREKRVLQNKNDAAHLRMDGAEDI